MKITVKLFATLRDGRFDEAELLLAEGATVRDALETLALQSEEAAIIFVNGRHADLESLLADGNTLSIFPPIGGG
jgi:sulfur carrier protein